MPKVATVPQVLHLYRRIIRAARSWPSNERNDVLAEAKQAFRSNRGVTDEVQIQEKVRINCDVEYASAALSQVACVARQVKLPKHVPCYLCNSLCPHSPASELLFFWLEQIKEGQNRLELGLHYGIPYQRLHHSSKQFRGSRRDIPKYD